MLVTVKTNVQCIYLHRPEGQMAYVPAFFVGDQISFSGLSSQHKLGSLANCAMHFTQEKYRPTHKLLSHLISINTHTRSTDAF